MKPQFCIIEPVFRNWNTCPQDKSAFIRNHHLAGRECFIDHWCGTVSSGRFVVVFYIFSPLYHYYKPKIYIPSTQQSRLCTKPLFHAPQQSYLPAHISQFVWYTSSWPSDRRSNLPASRWARRCNPAWGWHRPPLMSLLHLESAILIFQPSCGSLRAVSLSSPINL